MYKHKYTEAQRGEILKKYANEMSIIKLRTEQIFSANNRFDYRELAVEYKALQLRKIIEQILLASLVANAEEYKKYYDRLGTEWNAKYICQDLRRINPEFFPKAVNNRPDFQIDDKPEGISSQEILVVYDKLGKYLHSKNPFESNLWDYDAISDYIEFNLKHIIYTLNCHNVTLIGGDAFLNVVMKSQEHKGQVYAVWFDKCDEEEQQNAEQIINNQIERNKIGKA